MKALTKKTQLRHEAKFVFSEINCEAITRLGVNVVAKEDSMKGLWIETKHIMNIGNERFEKHSHSTFVSNN